MARGNPDYQRTIMGLSPTGYPASPAVIPHIWLIDDFESPSLKWYRNQGTLTLTTKTGVDDTDAEVINGSSSLKITSPVGDAIQVRFDFPPPIVQGRVGFAYKFYVFDYDNLAIDYEHLMFMKFLLDSGVTRRSGIIDYDPSTYKWYLSEDNGSTWIEFATHRLRSTSYSHIKLVVDLSVNKYVKFFIDGTEYDISSYNLYTKTAPGGSIGRFFIDIGGDTGDQAIMLVDDFTITIYES